MLATVFETQGSTYSKAGHAILISSSGDYQGLVSGGCLEGDLAERAHKAIAERRATPVTYDLRDEADELLRRRFSVVNVWRPIRGPLQDSPLAVSDAKSVRFDDLVATDLLYRNRTGEIYMVKFNTEQRWFYAPQMGTEEVLAFKCFDSAEDGRARFAPHAAFEDPSTPLDAWPRESIELRTLAFHAD